MAETPQDPRCAASIEDLQVRLAFLQHTVEQLDEVVRELGDDNLRLKRELTELRERVSMGTEGLLPEQAGDLASEKPPHY